MAGRHFREDKVMTFLLQQNADYAVLLNKCVGGCGLTASRSGAIFSAYRDPIPLVILHRECLQCNSSVLYLRTVHVNQIYCSDSPIRLQLHFFVEVPRRKSVIATRLVNNLLGNGIDYKIVRQLSYFQLSVKTVALPKRQ